MGAKTSSRWERGEARAISLTERDMQIFELLIRYRFLPIDYIHAFVGGSLKNLKHRMRDLYCAGYVNRPHQQRENADANYRHLVYELDAKGAQAIGSEKLRHMRNFKHELMTCQIAASIELGVKGNPAVKLLSWADIVASGRVPKETLATKHPPTISFELDGKPEHVTADWEPFVIQVEQGFTFFPGVEADCATEPIDATSDDRSSIRRKIRNYLHIMERRIHTSHFGASTFLVPFITTSEARMQSMMNLLRLMKSGEYGRYFLFKHIPPFNARQTPPATGHMLTEPWQRISGGPFCLDR